MNHIFFLFHMVSLIGVEASKAAMSTSVCPLSDSSEHIVDSRQVGTLKPLFHRAHGRRLVCPGPAAARLHLLRLGNDAWNESRDSIPSISNLLACNC